MDRPNFVVIVIDDMGWRDLVTGCYPARLHLTDWIPGYVRQDEKLLNPGWSPHLPAGQETIASMLARNGYRTASIGKWHLDRTPLDHGFSEASLYRKIRSHFYPYYSEPPYIPGDDGEYFADRLTDEALAFISEERDRPFLLYLGHNGVHRPLQAREGDAVRGGNRVPLIVRYPPVVRPASISPIPVSTVDFLPTLADLAGVPPEMRPQCDGENLEPVLRGAGGLKREALYWHYPHYHECAPWGAIRESDGKLVEYFEDGRVELYNLRTDLAEANDLSSAQPARASELRQALHEWRASVSAQMPPPAPRGG